MPRFSLDGIFHKNDRAGEDDEPVFDTPDMDYTDYDDDQGGGYADPEDDGQEQYGNIYDVEYDEDGYPLYDEDDPGDYGDYGDYSDEDEFVDAVFDGPDSYPAHGIGVVLNYVMRHDWVTWVLLLALPPLGIWLMWRRGMLNRNGRLAFSLLSGIWLVAAVALLFGRPQNPDDTQVQPQTITRQAQTEEQTADAADTSSQAAADLVDADGVYVTPVGAFYHLTADCQGIGDETANRAARSVAQEAGLMSCPYCAGGGYGVVDAVYMTNETVDVSGQQVFCSVGDSHFHTQGDCPAATSGGRAIGLKEALLMNKTACDSCCPTAARQVYCTADGTYYHSEDDCSGMKNARVVTYAEARVLGKVRCPKCIGGTPEENVDPNAGKEEETVAYYVYATAGGAYYHIDENCSGMQNAERYNLKEMLDSGRPACPVCCGAVEMTVFASRDNPYYHSTATCSGMTNVLSGQLVQALAAGLTRCPVCWVSDTTATPETAAAP